MSNEQRPPEPLDYEPPKPAPRRLVDFLEGWTVFLIGIGVIMALAVPCLWSLSSVKGK